MFLYRLFFPVFVLFLFFFICGYFGKNLADILANPHI